MLVHSEWAYAEDGPQGDMMIGGGASYGFYEGKIIDSIRELDCLTPPLSQSKQSRRQHSIDFY